MTKPNFANRTLWTGDNLEVLRGMNSDCVDLIYLDPPFNSNRNYAAPIGSDAAGAAFKDTWTLSDLDMAWMGLIADVHPAMYKVIEATGTVNGKSMQSYLCMMAVRLLEMRRILKDTGTIYLHCDPKAGHYLKLLMDSIFGEDIFWTAITWKRTSAHNDKLFGSESEMILMYGGGTQNLDDVRVPLSEKNLQSKYRYVDDKGKYRTGDLTGAGTSEGESGRPWRDFDPTNIGRHWAVPKTGKYAKYLDTNLLPGYQGIKGVHDRLDALDKFGMIHYSSRGGMPSLKRYLTPDAGQLPGNIWTDIPPVNSQASERTDYPTQKPLALMYRIIKASSNPEDMVLDPFCGCATTCVAADNLERQWVGIDISPNAIRQVNDRLRQSMGSLFHAGYVTSRTDIPRRTDIATPIPYRKRKHELFGKQEGLCTGCGIMFPFRNFTIDHIVPQSRGGTDHLENLQLLCAACNSLKGNRPQEYLLARLKEIEI